MATAVLVGAGIGTALLSQRAARRWAVNYDPCAGRPLDDLSDLGVTVRMLRTPDGAELSVCDARPKEVADLGGGELDRAVFVLAHCWTGDRRVWGPVARRLVAGGYRVVSYDHRGHGSSTLGDDHMSLATLAGDLELVLEALELSDVVLAGHSMGGMTIQALSKARGGLSHERVRAAVLVSTASGALIDPIVGRLGPSLIERDGLRSARSSFPLGARMFLGATPVAAHLDAIGETFLATPGAVRADMLREFAAMDLTDGLAAITQPVTVVVGSRDLATPSRHARRMARVARNARLEIVAGAGHMLPFEAPDRLAEILIETATAARTTGGPAARTTGGPATPSSDTERRIR
ncbi:MAG: alpha/beta fold hydrolase [Acidimicrobiales bacterium]